VSTSKKDIFQQLQRQILQLQGFKPPSSGRIDPGLGPITTAFPLSVFPTGAMHEFICAEAEAAAASGGFAAALVASLMTGGGACVWVSAARKIYPPGLKAFGIEPDQVIFIDLKKEKEVLWATEEALKCEGLAAVVGEVREIGFIASRRLQLAVEKSRVTGFLLRHNPRNLNPIAAVARWHITPLPSELERNMPGIGFPRWNVELSRVRNGQPGRWQMEWQAGRFHFVPGKAPELPLELRRQTG
jgi:protein ImuA